MSRATRAPKAQKAREGRPYLLAGETGVVEDASFLLTAPARDWAALSEDAPITCESLDGLILEGTRLLHTLHVIWHDLSLLKDGKRLVYALDFSELFSFLWPDKSRTYTRRVAKALLDCTEVQFTMPPGALVEFIYNLQRLSVENEHVHEAIKRLVSRPIVGELMSAFYGSPTARAGILGESIPRILDEVGKYSQFLETLQGLKHLRKMPNLVPIDAVIRGLGLKEATIDREIYAKCFYSLRTRRPDVGWEVNHVDAHNYALAWDLSTKHFNKSDVAMLLVTSSPHPYEVFKTLIWDTFPETIAAPLHPRLSLVRHPITVLYTSRFLRQGGSPTNEIRRMVNSLNAVLQEWRSLPSYKLYLRDRTDSTLMARLPSSEKYLGSFARLRKRYLNTLLPVIDAVRADVIAEENLRKVSNIDATAIGTRETMDGIGGEAVSKRSALELFEEVAEAALVAINAGRKTLKGLPRSLVAEVDCEGVLQKGTLRLRSRRNGEFHCREVVVRSQLLNETFFAGDLYDDYYALWWPTGASLMEYLREARSLVNGLASEERARMMGTEGRKKKYAGIYLYYGSSAEFSHIRWHAVDGVVLDAIRDASKGRRLTMLRLASEFADVFYDLEPSFSLAQRAGLVSHVAAPDPVAWFMQRTHLRRVRLPHIRTKVDVCFERYQHG
jgi:hypothetical protein